MYEMSFVRRTNGRAKWTLETQSKAEHAHGEPGKKGKNGTTTQQKFFLLWFLFYGKETADRWSWRFCYSFFECEIIGTSCILSGQAKGLYYGWRRFVFLG